MLIKTFSLCIIPTLIFSYCCYAQEKIYFEPKSASGGKQSDFIVYNATIAFETTAESRFDKYSSIFPTKNYFVVCDNSAKKILLFSKTGRFIKKIKSKKRLDDFWYNEQTDRLEIVTGNKMYRLTNKDNAQIQEDYMNPKNRKYFQKYVIALDDTINLSAKKEKIAQKDILEPLPYINGMHIFNKVTVNKDFTATEDYELKIYKGDSLLKQYFKYDKKNDPRYIYTGAETAVTPAMHANERWVTHAYDYKIYALKNDSLYEVFDLILPMERAIPNNFFSREFRNKTEKNNYLRQNQKLVKQIYVYSLSKKYINFNLQSMTYDTQEFIYDTKTKVFYNYDKINADSLTFYLPLLKSQQLKDGAVTYALLTAEEALKALEAGKKEKINYPPLLEAYLKTATAETNPVLINFTYKD